MSRDMPRLEQPSPLHQTVQDAIRNYIVDNRLRPGDPMLPETELARRLGVSRNSVREAVKSLEGIGILEARRGSGLYVREFSWDSLLDNLAYDLMRDIRSLAELLEIRRVLELGMVADALERLTPEQITALRGLLERMRELAERGESFPDEDREFHRVLFRELENGTFLRLLDIFWLAFRKASRGANLIDATPVATYEAHRSIVDALDEGDVERTRRALEEHYASITVRLRQQLETNGPPAARISEEVIAEE